MGFHATAKWHGKTGDVGEQESHEHRHFANSYRPQLVKTDDQVRFLDEVSNSFAEQQLAGLLLYMFGAYRS